MIRPNVLSFDLDFRPQPLLRLLLLTALSLPFHPRNKKNTPPGVNEDGQLGLDGESDVLSPKVVEALLGTRLRGRAFNRCPLVAGSRCTLALDAEGRVLAWGWNARGTLGHGSSKGGGSGGDNGGGGSAVKQQQRGGNHNASSSFSSSFSSSAERKPRRVSALFGSRIVQAATGGWHCLALDSEGGAWAWVRREEKRREFGKF